jgi:uncharacterized protein with HEPN domain
LTTPDEVRLEEMLVAIERTKGYVARGRPMFLSDYDTRELIIHHLEHLSESADQASQRLKKANPLVPWKDLRELRTRLIHQYMRPDPQAVWAFVRDRLPRIERLLRRVRAKSAKTEAAT